jgi:hypothetical protein
MPNGDSSQLADDERSPGSLLMLAVERDFEKPFGLLLADDERTLRLHASSRLQIRLQWSARRTGWGRLRLPGR